MALLCVRSAGPALTAAQAVVSQGAQSIRRSVASRVVKAFRDEARWAIGFEERRVALLARVLERDGNSRWLLQPFVVLRDSRASRLSQGRQSRG